MNRSRGHMNGPAVGQQSGQFARALSPIADLGLLLALRLTRP